MKLSPRQQKAVLGLASACGAVLYLAANGMDLMAETLSGAPRFGRSALSDSSSGGGVRRSLALSYDTSSTLPLPPFYDNAANVWETPVIAQDQPFFWYVPKAGGSTLSKIFTFCLDFVSCSPMAIESPSDYLVRVSMYKHA